MSYLGGKGNRNEHVDARVITGSASVQLRTGYAVRLIDSTAARRELTALLDAPHRESGRQAPIPVKDRKGNRIGTRDGHVWHCSLSMPPGERVSDASAAELARRFIEQMKLDSCEWAAIRHDGEQSNPHLHLVVNVVKPDGRLASTHRDYSRAQAACARYHRRPRPDRAARSATPPTAHRADLLALVAAADRPLQAPTRQDRSRNAARRSALSSSPRNSRHTASSGDKPNTTRSGAASASPRSSDPTSGSKAPTSAGRRAT